MEELFTKKHGRTSGVRRRQRCLADLAREPGGCSLISCAACQGPCKQQAANLARPQPVGPHSWGGDRQEPCGSTQACGDHRRVRKRAGTRGTRGYPNLRGPGPSEEGTFARGLKAGGAEDGARATHQQPTPGQVTVPL